mmetsp:Transcript_25546/g.40035  ORF Transcript_25546/g.40035 Transcript_25546/m.40035 type:complete len:164 (+) Transcript_25546:593-1084(+)
MPRDDKSRFGPEDRIRVTLNFFEEQATFVLDTGYVKTLGSIGGIMRAVRFGFQMYSDGDSVQLLSYEDLTNTLPDSQKAEALARKAQRRIDLVRETHVKREERLELILTAEKLFDKASRLFSLVQDSEKTNLMIAGYQGAKVLKVEVEMEMQQALMRPASTIE